MMTEEQKNKVEENIGLVWKVIADKLHGQTQFGMYTKDDIFQIGCIGLCKAILTDTGGNFSTYAYRLIWHQICDALVYASRRQVRETTCDVLPKVSEEGKGDAILKLDLEHAIAEAMVTAPNATAKGILAMKLMAAGYTSKEIGMQMNASDKLVCAWVSKARKYLRNQKGIQELVKA